MHGTIVCGVTDTAEAETLRDWLQPPRRSASASDSSWCTSSRAPVAAYQRARAASQRGRGASIGAGRLARAICDASRPASCSGAGSTRSAQVAADEGADVIVLGSRARRRRLAALSPYELEAAQAVPVLVARGEPRPQRLTAGSGGTCRTSLDNRNR